MEGVRTSQNIPLTKRFFAHKQPSTRKSSINERTNPPDPVKNMEVDKPPKETETEIEMDGDEHPEEMEGGKPPKEAKGDKPPKKKVYPGWCKKSLEKRKKGTLYARH